MKVNGQNLNNQRYADDTVLNSSTGNSLQKVLDRMAEEREVKYLGLMTTSDEKCDI